MLNGTKLLERPLRWGMIGGGETSQVGYKHRTGALRDQAAYQLVCGALDLDQERGQRFGTALGIAADRCYPDYLTMIEAEAARTDGVEVVSIATPNFTHFDITKACLNAGLHVICEKPLFFSVAECQEIAQLARQQQRIVGVTYGYSGHPMLKQMKAMIAQGALGEIRMVDLQYTHGFNAADGEQLSEAQAWRTNPATSGPTFVLGDLATHTFHMSQMVLPEMKIEKLLCDRQSLVASHAPLEDNAHVLFHYQNGAVGRLWTSSVDAGNMDAQKIRVVGSKASLQWSAAYPDDLHYQVQGQPNQHLHRGMPYLDQMALANDRMGALHSEGLGDSWANVYQAIAKAIEAMNQDDQETLAQLDYPGIEAGMEGVRWLENCVRSANAGATWVTYE